MKLMMCRERFQHESSIRHLSQATQKALYAEPEKEVTKAG